MFVQSPRTRAKKLNNARQNLTGLGQRLRGLVIAVEIALAYKQGEKGTQRSREEKMRSNERRPQNCFPGRHFALLRR